MSKRSRGDVEVTSTEKALRIVSELAREWRAPVLAFETKKAARPDQDNLTDASEYLDDPDTLSSKVKAVAMLLREANHCACYTGAGISKSSGIPDYATHSKRSIAHSNRRLRDPADALPTPAHDALASLHRAGYIRAFVNQNHDALFEKAGVSVMHSNLIHGDWFDIANPVVQYDESLRDDLFNRLLDIERKTDLVLVAGTSLSGMNADRLALTCAGKWSKKRRGILGTVIVNLQNTCLDDKAVVRVWCKTDDFCSLLAEELAVTVEKVRPPAFQTEVFSVPYDTYGKRLPDADPRRLSLDLRADARIKVSHPEASNFGEEYIIARAKDPDGNWEYGRMQRGRFSNCGRYGRWFVHAALNGELAYLPCVNVDARFVDNV